ncbi:putative pentatricopeptide repeat-containing protein [Prunus yedoensis var. nudiflora]|uniref:Putative pentatricopeptide repeat-containing protein n=1 Tax=Prunus yedoensis var. nudiflora TaxID=2094558 RepID=A0A314XH83_PRUYE|nr:putative pentatricopeptide repeat-containing protein [Prunus yedoensis var. nudiflora]
MNASKSISPFRLSSLLRRQKDPILALQLFQNPKPDSTPQPKKPFRYSLLSYDLIITKLGRAKMFDQMDQILHQLKQEPRFAPPEIIFCNVISFYGRAHLPDRALQMFDKIPTFRCHRTVKSLNSLLNALLRCGEFEKICCSNEYLDDAWKVLDEMSRKGIPPNSLKEAFKLKEDMAKEEMLMRKIKPDAAVYSTLISGLFKLGRKGEEGKWSEANDLFEDLPRRGCPPDVVSYRIMFTGLCDCRQFREAALVLDEMIFKGYAPHCLSAHKLVEGLCREGDMEFVRTVLTSMGNGNVLHVDTWAMVISMVCKKEKLSNVSELVDSLLV